AAMSPAGSAEDKSGGNRRRVIVMTASAPSPFQVGQTIQEYRLRQLRGNSSFGFVWEAENLQGAPRALKFLPDPNAPATRQEIRAIQLVAKFKHPHLMPVEKLWSIPKYFVVATELADASLQDLFEAYQSAQGTGIEPSELCTLLAGAAAGLDFLN